MNHIKELSNHSSVVKSEHVVEAEETCRTTWEKVEHLSKLHWVLVLTDVEVTGNEAQDSVVH